ncbi:hypothetical protein SAMN05421825_2783 [Epilithonimonas hungarica]|uniref:Uncharacterized protein n=1 Tax=Epilithonimonas hungarica TaxID=454006 RepID=A0A1G7RUN3_9FLAO|nr:hypothetical protein SAMN05421825_2783 [Epilithonimonas hungarica]
MRSGKVNAFFIIRILSCYKKLFAKIQAGKGFKQTLLSAYSGK